MPERVVDVLATMDVIEVGDFIRAKQTTCCGFVRRTGSAGRSDMSGFWVVTTSGREDFIDAGAAVLLHKRDAWWDRYAAALDGVHAQKGGEAVDQHSDR